MNEVYCRGCGSKISATAQYCPLCGSAQTGPAPQPPPPYQPPPQTIVVKQGNSGTFWIILTLLAIFTPLGCIIFPVLILGGGAAALAGIALAPLLLTCAPFIIGMIWAGRVWQNPYGGPTKRSTATGVACIGAAISLIVGYSVFGGSKPQPSTPIVEATPLPEKRPYIAWLDFDAFGRDYDRNKMAIKSKYGIKRIALRGKVGTIDQDAGNGYGTMMLKGMQTLAEITCYFNERTTPQLANVQPGQMVDVIGEFDGGIAQSFGSDKLKMYDCTFPATAKAVIQKQ